MSAALKLPDLDPTAAAHALWRDGDLSYLLHRGTTDPTRGQLALRDRIRTSGHRTTVAVTSRRYGKSRCCCVVAVEYALQYPGLRIPYAAPTGEQIEEFVEPHMEMLKEEAPEELAPFKFKGQWRLPPYRWMRADSYDGDRARIVQEVDHLVCVDTGKESRIVMKGCDEQHKADKLRGPGALFAILDEAGFIKLLTYVRKSVIGPMFWEARSVWGAGADPRLLVTSTPPTELDHPFVAMKEEAEAKGSLFTANVYDAPHLSAIDIEEAIAEAGGADTVDWQREGLAQFVVDPTKVVFPEFGRLESVIVQEHPRPTGPDGVEYFDPMIVGDLGYFDMTVIAFGYYDFANDLEVIEDELVFQRETSATIVPAVDAKARELWGDRPVYRRRIDASAFERAELGRPLGNLQEVHGDPLAAANEQHFGEPWGMPRKDEKRAAVNAYRIRLGAARVRVNPKCKTIIAHMKHARWNRLKTDWVRVKRDGEQHHYDGASTGLYFHRSVDTTKNPYPRFYPGTSLATHVLRPAREDDRAGLIRAFSTKGHRHG